jgi:hypothetical protein
MTKPRTNSRWVCCWLFLVLLSAGTTAYAAPMERNTDRPGADYRSFDLPTPKPARCRNACAREARCQAWTYVRPGVQGPHARCWLKHAVPQPRHDTCCVSGVKRRPPVPTPPPVPPPAPAMERNTDRPGADYRSFNLPAPEPARCRNACAREARCQAWTYVRPGVQGPYARCWLKHAVPQPRHDTCCVSGVKR